MTRPVASEIDWARIEAFMARKTVLRVRCPHCLAYNGAPCMRLGAVVRPHPSRVRAAKEAAA